MDVLALWKGKEVIKRRTAMDKMAMVLQLQPQPPPQQLPLPPEEPPDDFAEAPLLDPFAALKTDN